jgi:hypothetical protein
VENPGAFSEPPRQRPHGGQGSRLDVNALDAAARAPSGSRATTSSRSWQIPSGTNLLRNRVDIVTVAELMGHRRLDTTRLYTLPTERELEDAVARLPTDQ